MLRDPPGLPQGAGVPIPSLIKHVFLDFSIFYGINRCSGGFGKVRLVTPEVLTKFQLKRTILDPFREKNVRNVSAPKYANAEYMSYKWLVRGLSGL